MTVPFRFVGINFDHMHMGDLLRLVHAHPSAEIAGICDADPRRMAAVIANFNIPPDRVFTDVAKCLRTTQPDGAILCPATGKHADYVEQVAPHKVPILVEKPFAASLKDADRMIAAAKKYKVRLAINWPLRWVASHVTAHRLVTQGRIGRLQEIHYYDGNRGPLYHTADKIELQPTPAQKKKSWFYQRDHGGGSLLDYLGYGVTLGTWFNAGQKPLDVTTVTAGAKGLEVDEHSITICRYAGGMSKFETRWGTFTDPWIAQPQPKCGFVLKGSAGTISSYDYEPTVRMQTAEQPAGVEIPAEPLVSPYSNAIEYFVHCLRTGEPFSGPLCPKTCRIAQQIVDTALASASRGKTLPLVDR